MIILFLWLLLYPLVVAACFWVYATQTDSDLGQLNAGYAAVYAIGTILLTVLHYV